MIYNSIWAILFSLSGIWVAFWFLSLAISNTLGPLLDGLTRGLAKTKPTGIELVREKILQFLPPILFVVLVLANPFYNVFSKVFSMEPLVVIQWLSVAMLGCLTVGLAGLILLFFKMFIFKKGK